MGYRLNRPDEPVFMVGPKPMRTEFGIHQRLKSCASLSPIDNQSQSHFKIDKPFVVVSFKSSLLIEGWTLFLCQAKYD